MVKSLKIPLDTQPLSLLFSYLVFFVLLLSRSHRHHASTMENEMSFSFVEEEVSAISFLVVFFEVKF